MPENNEPRPQDYILLAAVVGTTAFGVYHLGKLGVDWAREGVRSRKEKKNEK
jgi:hypothetical protein